MRQVDIDGCSIAQINENADILVIAVRWAFPHMASFLRFALGDLIAIPIGSRHAKMMAPRNLGSWHHLVHQFSCLNRGGVGR